MKNWETQCGKATLQAVCSDITEVWLHLTGPKSHPWQLFHQIQQNFSGSHYSETSSLSSLISLHFLSSIESKWKRTMFPVISFTVRRNFSCKWLTEGMSQHWHATLLNVTVVVKTYIITEMKPDPVFSTEAWKLLKSMKEILLIIPPIHMC